MPEAAVYSIKQFEKNAPADPNPISKITSSVLDQLIKDFKNAKYVCIMIREGEAIDLPEAQQSVEESPTITGISGEIYFRGFAKGSPPGTSSPLK